MTKQERIEEMARIIAFDLCPKRRIHANYGEEAKCYSDNNFAECTQIKNVVDKLYNAGYRKADEVRKETAEDILQKITEKDHKILAWEYGVGYMDCMKNLKSVISEYGVDLGE